MIPDDMALVRQYARDNSEADFAALVERHINLVYSVAIRQVGNAHLAEEITQAVFVILARKAGGLGPKTILSAWLCRTSRYVAANALTVQRRRHLREQEAHFQSTMNEPEPQAWDLIAPLLDDALGRLGQKDHDAIVLRFLENKSLGEVGAAIGTSEDTARMRVNRAVAKLRKYFLKRGVDSTAAAITGAISANSIQAAPVTLAKVVTATAITKGAAASVSTITLIKGTLKFMAWTKAKTAIVVSACLVLTAGTTTAILVCNRPRPVHGIPTDWTVLSGNRDQWNWANNTLYGQSTNGDTILASNQKYGDVTVSAIVGSTNRGAELVLRIQDADNGYHIIFTPDGTPWAAENGSCVKLLRKISGDETDLAIFKRRGLAQSAKITVSAKGSRIEVRLNDVLILTTNDATFASGYIGLRVYGDPIKPSDATFSNLTFQ